MFASACILLNVESYGQWQTFNFTDEWGDETDDLGARSAYTKAARPLEFPYQDRKMSLYVEDCNTAWIRFNNNMVFETTSEYGILRGFKVRIDGKEIDIWAMESDSRNINLRDDQSPPTAIRLIALLGAANRAEFLIPLHDSSPARFNLNMSGSGKAINRVCSKEMLGNIAQEKEEQRKASEARAQEQIEKAREAREAVEQEQREKRERGDRIREVLTLFCQNQDATGSLNKFAEFYDDIEFYANPYEVRLKRNVWDSWSLTEKKELAHDLISHSICMKRTRAGYYYVSSRNDNLTGFLLEPGAHALVSGDTLASVQLQTNEVLLYER